MCYLGRFIWLLLNKILLASRRNRTKETQQIAWQKDYCRVSLPLRVFQTLTRSTHFKKCFTFHHICIQFSSVSQLCPTLCNPMDCSRPGLPVHHQFPELAQTHVHGVGDDIQPSHPLSSPSSPSFNLPQHQGLFQWVSSLHQVAQGLELQLQPQSFQWIFRTDFL